jgi:CheY-like chemotaxis protein
MDEKTILVVEDNGRWRDLLRVLFRPQYQVEEASSFRDAEARLKDQQFGLVITNLQLGSFVDVDDEMGLMVVETLQDSAPGTPCIILTGSDQTKQKQVRNFCEAKYNAPIWVMGKGSDNLYKELLRRVTETLERRNALPGSSRA